MPPLGTTHTRMEDSIDVASLFSRTEFPNCSVKCLQLHQRLSALTDGGRVLGFLNSRRSKPSNVFAQRERTLRGCQIQYFCEGKLSVARVESVNLSVV